MTESNGSVSGHADLGRNRYYILIDNLDKNLSSSAITDFLYEQTAIFTRACVYPSLSFHAFARGAVVFDSKEKAQVIYDYLTNPDHMIVSSTLSPWVVTGTIETGSSVLFPYDQISSSDDELKVVRQGDREFEIAKRIKKLFMECVRDLEKLGKELEAERVAIIQKTFGTSPLG